MVEDDVVREDPDIVLANSSKLEFKILESDDLIADSHDHVSDTGLRRLLPEYHVQIQGGDCDVYVEPYRFNSNGSLPRAHRMKHTRSVQNPLGEVIDGDELFEEGAVFSRAYLLRAQAEDYTIHFYRDEASRS